MDKYIENGIINFSVIDVASNTKSNDALNKKHVLCVVIL